MKFIKGVAIFLVLCLAAYGAYTLLKKSPQLDITESDRAILEILGINVQDNQASESGLSGVFNDVEGVTPIGATMGAASSAPPSFLSEPTTSYVPPSFLVAPAPPVGMELQNVPTYSDEPTGFPVQPPATYQQPVLSVPQSETQPAPAVQVPAVLVPATESPPPWTENWDGPASNLPVTLSPTESFHSPFPTNTPPRTGDKITSLPTLDKKVRRIIPDSTSQRSFSVASTTTNNVPLDTSSSPIPQYTKTAARQPIAFEPVKPALPPNAPIVTFATPKRVSRALYSEPSRQIETDQQPVASSLSERRDEESRPIENPAAQPGTLESVERFIQSQRSLVDSGDPENIRRAYIHLSQLYEHNRLGNTERAMLYPILDMLALRVIYAKDTHILEPPYRVKPGETIESIANDFNLTPVLLRKINDLSPTQDIMPGATLKVLYGQFDAQISIQQNEITLLLGGLYAGRFPFSLSNPGMSLRSGEFYVANHANRTIVLNNGLVLSTAHAKNATVVFADHDAREIFDILSEKSVIVVE